MFESAVVEPEADEMSPSALLRALRSARAAKDAAAAEQVVLAATWADLHPPESIHAAAVFTVPGSEHEEPIAGEGCPAVAEFCVAELGAVLGMSTVSAKRLLGHALELRHRLPRLWAKVQAGQVPAWRARSVAEATIHATPALTRDAAGWIDSQVAAVAARVGPAQLDRLVAEAIKRHHLAEEVVDPDDGLGVDPRHATVDREQVSYAGTLRVEAEVSLVDGIDLDHALAARAETLKALGSTESLDVRRSQALGDLARLQTSLDLAGLSEDLGPMPGNVAYAVSKAALAGATASVADELAEAGILLNTVNPGPVNTGYLDAAPEGLLERFPAGRYGQPEDPARLIGWLVPDDGEWMVGQVLHTDGGFRR